MNAIELKKVCKSYPAFSLKDISFALPCGCIMGLVGENGAGKSTTIKLILDMVRRDSGSITVLGREPQRDAAWKEDVGVVLDEVGILECMKAEQVERMMQGIYRRWDSGVFWDYLERLNVPKDKPFGQFSRGTKMKLGIAVALSHGAKLLILDEATGGLDPVVRDEVLTLFSDFTRSADHAVLISSHIVSDLEKICDYIAFIHQGQLLLCEEKDRLYEQYRVLHTNAAALSKLDAKAVIGVRKSKYDCEAIVRADALPHGAEASPIDLEQLFITMVKGEENNDGTPL